MVPGRRIRDRFESGKTITASYGKAHYSMWRFWQWCRKQRLLDLQPPSETFQSFAWLDGLSKVDKSFGFTLGCAIMQAAKICNNMALAVSMAGVSEALLLGQKLGVDAHTLSDIFNCSSARCWSRYGQRAIG